MERILSLIGYTLKTRPTCMQVKMIFWLSSWSSQWLRKMSMASMRLWANRSLNRVTRLAWRIRWTTSLLTEMRGDLRLVERLGVGAKYSLLCKIEWVFDNSNLYRYPNQEIIEKNRKFLWRWRNSLHRGVKTHVSNEKKIGNNKHLRLNNRKPWHPPPLHSKENSNPIQFFVYV